MKIFSYWDDSCLPWALRRWMLKDAKRHTHERDCVTIEDENTVLDGLEINNREIVSYRRLHSHIVFCGVKCWGMVRWYTWKGDHIIVNEESQMLEDYEKLMCEREIMALPRIRDKCGGWQGDNPCNGDHIIVGDEHKRDQVLLIWWHMWWDEGMALISCQSGCSLISCQSGCSLILRVLVTMS